MVQFNIRVVFVHELHEFSIVKNFFLLFIVLGATGLLRAQNEVEDLSVLGSWKYIGDMSNALYNHICSIALAQLDERRLIVEELKTRDDWVGRQAELKKILAELVGEFPARTPLNPVITGKLKGDGFTVEKLYFESRPVFYVTAALFLPTAGKGRLPAILYCSGHHLSSFRVDVYQTTVLNLVKKGFVVLAIDPVGQGERIEYLGADGKIDENIDATLQHSFPGTQSFLSGFSPINYFIWDGIRAVDYLISRKEVDPARLGITGQSGGGLQTVYIAAMDDRLLATAPETSICTYEKLLRKLGTGDAEQNQPYFLKKGFEKSDLLEIRAPKPTLLVSTTRDFGSIQGSRDVFYEAQKAFAAFGVPDNLQMAEDDDIHTCTTKNREAIIAFFQKHLRYPGDPKEEKVVLFDEKELYATPTGLVQKSLQTESVFSLNMKYSEEALQLLQAEKQHNPVYYQQMAQRTKSLTGYSDPVLPKEAIFAGRLWRDDCAIEKYMIKGQGSYYIPLLRFAPGAYNGSTILLLDDQGKASAAAKGALVDRLARLGYQVVVPDLIGFGEIGLGFKDGNAMIHQVYLNNWYIGLLTHKTQLAVRVEELKIITGFIRSLDLSGPLTGIACGTLTPDLLHAAVINNDFERIALVNPLYAYQSIIQERDYLKKFIMSAPPGVIGQYDLSDLVAAIAPLKICMINPVDALDHQVEPTVFDQLYEDVKKQYGDLSDWTVVFDEQDVFLWLEQWLSKK